MNILVLNGSPKGECSISLQTALFLEKMHPEHVFHVLHAARNIQKYANDFSQAKEELKWANLILFVCPVYSFLVPGQLHVFIDEMKESEMDYSDKYASLITTSKRFYDVTAHEFIKENCQDMKMKYVEGLSQDMDDLLSEKGQKDALSYFDYLIYSVEHSLFESIPHYSRPSYKTVEIPEKDTDKNLTKTVAIVADLNKSDSQLASLIESFSKKIACKIKLINLHDFKFFGGCIGCLNCVTNGECIYQDGFTELLRREIQSCDGIVLAFSIKDHSLGPKFKIYDDRQFVNGHRTVTMGMPIAYLVSGNLSEERNLEMLLKARASVGGNFLCGIVSDESDPNTEMDYMIHKMEYALMNLYNPPVNFYGTGGAKIFRDLVYQTRGMMKLDYAFYKEHDQFDFPQNKPFTILEGYLVGALLNNPKIKQKLGNKINEGAVKPYKKIVDSANPKKI